MIQESLRFLSCSFDRQRGEGFVENKSGAMVDSQGCLLSKFFKSTGHECDSFHKYLLACKLLVNDGSLLLKEVKENVYGKNMYMMPSLDQEERKKKEKKYGVKSHQGRDCNGKNSSDCFLPGLHDDMALDCLARVSRSDYSSLARLNKEFNLLMGSGYLYKLRRQLGIVEHWVYVACSLMPWGAFDPFRLRWISLPRMPCDECFFHADKESLAVGTQLLVFGRELTGFAILMYSIVSRDWSRCPPMNLSRCLFGSGSFGEIAIVAGGVDKNGRVLKSAELYNSELGRWETLPDMKLPRKLCSGFFMDRKFYVIGGMLSLTDSLSCGEEYDLDTRSWKTIPDMYPGSGNRATHSPPLVAVVNNQLYAADQSTNEVKKYNKENSTWNVVTTLPVRADSNNGWGLAFKACGDKLLVIGGHRGPQGEVIVLHSWCPEDEDRNGEDTWDVLSVRERAGAFVYNCAIMGC